MTRRRGERPESTSQAHAFRKVNFSLVLCIISFRILTLHLEGSDIEFRIWRWQIARETSKRSFVAKEGRVPREEAAFIASTLREQSSAPRALKSQGQDHLTRATSRILVSTSQRLELLFYPGVMDMREEQ